MKTTVESILNEAGIEVRHTWTAGPSLFVIVGTEEAAARAVDFLSPLGTVSVETQTYPVEAHTVELSAV